MAEDAGEYAVKKGVDLGYLIIGTVLAVTAGLAIIGGTVIDMIALI